MRYLKIPLFLFLFLFLSGCSLRDPVQDDHVALMFSNIIETSRAQRMEGAPVISQTGAAIETAAHAGLKALGYKHEEK